MADYIRTHPYVGAPVLRIIFTRTRTVLWEYPALLQSAAYCGGLREMHRVTHVNGQPVANWDEYRQALSTVVCDRVSS